MRVVAILQARINSSRLPGKMLLPILNKPLVQHVIERTRRATKLDFVVLAYPLADHEAFAPVLKSLRNTFGVPLGSYAGQGDENDLVSRYLGAATAYGADVIVRIPCDNPCVDPKYIDTAIETYLLSPSVFYTNTTGLHWDVALDGVGCEVFSMSRLKWMDQHSQGNSDKREHPHLCFRKYRDYDLPEATILLDVNTQADYEFIRNIYDHFGHNRFTTAEILGALTTKEVSHEIRKDEPVGR